MGLVFVSYRVKDFAYGAAAIHDRLVDRFGAAMVFQDCVSMQREIT